ncbi:MAG: FAD:protein FMN transferase [Bacilli bacterium]|nr:FAD:protein FMN transferase [Bacilli bacterium]
MMKRLLLFIPLLTLISCSQTKIVNSKIFCFDTMININLYEGDSGNLKDIEGIFTRYDKLSDNYRSRDVHNVYTINHTNEEVVVDNGLYNLLNKAFSVKNEGAAYFDPLCGSLSKKWKESLEKGEVLSDEIINEELEKMHVSSIEFNENNKIKRLGEAEIDVGGIAKGYALDEVYTYLKNKDISHYLVNAGSSSILVGEKNNKSGLFSIGINDLTNAYIELKNCFVSTSGVSTQGVKINDVTYSHIINPVTGSAINNYDAVIVISDKGYLGDALSTSMMMNSVDEIKEIEEIQNVKTIVIKDKKIVYSNKDIEVKYH